MDRTEPVAFSLTTAPTQDGNDPGSGTRPRGPTPGVVSPPGSIEAPRSSSIGSIASVPCHTVAPALTARSRTMASRSWRVMT